MDSENNIVLDAVLLEKKELCYTPAGVAVFEAGFHYSGQQLEAGAMRKVEFDFTAMAFANTAKQLDEIQPGTKLHMRGFLAQRSVRNTKLTIHITEFNIRS